MFIIFGLLLVAFMVVAPVSYTHLVPMENVFRKDIVRESYDRAELLFNAPTKTEEYIYVPKAFE